MTLKERFEAAKTALAEVKSAVEAGKKSAEDLQSAITELETVQAQIKAADEAEALMKGLETPKAEKADKEEEKTMENKTLGARVAETLQSKGADFRENRYSITIKAAAPMIIPSDIKPAITDYDKEIVLGYRRPFTIADLFGAERISGGILKFFVESSTVEGSISTTTEGQKKPMMSFGNPAPKTVELKKLPVYAKISTEMMEDAPFMEDYINGRLLHQHRLAVEDFLISELSGTSGIGTSSVLTPEGIFKAMMTVQNSSGFAADAIVINPTDYQNIRLRKDQNGQYYGGGFFYGQYGNGGMTEQPALWGVRTVVTPAVAVGTCIVGAFKMGASVLHGVSGTTVNIANQNEDDFIKNLVTILIEERLALAVRRPACFVKITGSSTSTEA